ncbi:MAG: ribulose-phosphate 3-epimerase [Actinobacteria bacterium]|nr:ribulose-phosphate 3-epimerase [Actinomycetota bacterium]
MGWEGARAVEIEPSLYAADFARLGDEVTALLDAGARVFHFDVGDGHFVEPITIGPVVLRAIAPLVSERGGLVDCHLMVEDPRRHIPQIAGAGGHSVTFHVEVGAVEQTAALAREHGLGVGVAFNPDTPVATAAEAAHLADICLCMSIYPGYSGQAFLPQALGRVRELRGLLGEGARIQVDGGIGPENIGAVRSAGANLFVAGSSIFGAGDPAAAFRELERAAG